MKKCSMMILLCMALTACGASTENTVTTQVTDEVVVDAEMRADVDDEYLTAAYTPGELDAMEFVDKTLVAFAESDAFKNATLEERYTMSCELLEELSSKHLIRNVHWEQENSVAGFEYIEFEDGRTLGIGVMPMVLLEDREGKRGE